MAEKNPNFIRFILLLGLMIFISTFSGSLLAANKPEFIFERFPDISPIMYSLYDVVGYLSYFIGIVLGVISDNKNERKFFISIGSVGSMVFLYLLTIVHNYSLLLSLRFIEGCFSIMIWQNLMILSLDYSDRSNRAKNMSIMIISIASAVSLGSIIGGKIAEQGTFIPYYYSIVLRGSIFILNILFINNPTNIIATPTLKESLFLIKNHPQLVVPSIFNFVDRFHMGFILLIFPLFAIEVFQSGPSFRGIILGIANIPAILLMYYVGKKSDTNWGRFKPLFFGSLGYGIVFCAIGLIGHKNISLFIVFILIQGVFSGFTTSPLYALVGDLVENKNNGMAIALFNFMGNFGIVVGPFVGGFIIQFYDFSIAFIIAGLIELFSLSINIFLAKKMNFLTL